MLLLLLKALRLLARIPASSRLHHWSYRLLLHKHTRAVNLYCTRIYTSYYWLTQYNTYIYT